MPWNHDQPYYCVNGNQNVSMWIALDAVPAQTTMRFIAGSHKRNRWFIPRIFVDATPYAEEDEHYERIPDLDAEIGHHQVISRDVEPGEVIVFHYRAVHDGPGNPLDDARFALVAGAQS
jgi:ectoine hydroxylase-related dioxygenase (phytanoyl-CoA dioxygenase family)